MRLEGKACPIIHKCRASKTTTKSVCFCMKTTKETASSNGKANTQRKLFKSFPSIWKMYSATTAVQNHKQIFQLCCLSWSDKMNESVVFCVFISSFSVRSLLIYLSIIATGFVFSWSFSKSPWSKNSSATIFATRCWTSHGFAIALTSQAVIIMPHNTFQKERISIKTKMTTFS